MSFKKHVEALAHPRWPQYDYCSLATALERSIGKSRKTIGLWDYSQQV